MLRSLLLTALAPMLWGMTYIVTTQFLPADRPLLVAAARALPIGLLIVLFARKLPRGSWWWRAAVLGALNFGVFFAFLFVGAGRLPGGVAATLGAIQPLVVVLLAGPLLGERPALVRVVAAAFGVVGVGLLVLGPSARLDAIGVGAALLAALSMAFGTMFTKRWGQPVSPLVFTGWQLVAGGLMLVPVALLVEGAPPAVTTTNLLGFAYMGLVNTGLAYVLWFRGIKMFKASQIAFLGLLSPVVAVLVGFVVLHQTLSALQLLGVVIVLLSIFAAQRRPQRAPGATPGLHTKPV